VRPSFALSLNERDRSLVEDLRMYFGCGWIRESRRDRTVKYESRSTSDLLTRIVPHFERYPLRGSKRRSFLGFGRICRMIEQGDHLEPAGLREIVAMLTR
jgi:LAGLIDADG endonuclease